jgi:hypothetical protein
MKKDLNSELPDWVEKRSGNFTMKDLFDIFKQDKTSCDYPDLKLECSDGCGAMMYLSYYGLLHIYPSDHHEDECIQFNHRYPENKTDQTADNITIDITKEGVLDSIYKVLDSIKKAVSFKKDLIKGICYFLEFNLDNVEVDIAVREEETRIVFLLFKISEKLNVVQLLENPAICKDFLGVVHVMDKNADIKKIGRGNEDLKNPLLKPIFDWVENLFKENSIQLEKRVNLWIMRYC